MNDISVTNGRRSSCRALLLFDGVFVGSSFHLDLVFRFFEIGVDEEVAEENEVAGVHAEREVDVRYTNITAFSVVHHLEGVYVDKNTCHHLKNLTCSNADWNKLGSSVTGCSDSIVTVHNSVNHVVDCAEPSTSCDRVPVAVPAVNKDSDVMIPVQEYQSLLSQHNENCISEFWQLAEHEEKSPERRVILRWLLI